MSTPRPGSGREVTGATLPPAPPASTDAARRVMQGNRRSDTRPEKALRSELHRRGLRFRIDLKVGTGRSAPRPDVVFPRALVAIYVDGCFWHACPVHGVEPRTNSDYWRAKLARNVARDARNREALEREGWLVIRVWEHEDPRDAADRIAAAVRDRLSGR